MKLDKTHLRLALFGALFGTLGFACLDGGGSTSDDDDGSAGAGASGSTTAGGNGSGSGWYCCLNDVGYACPHEAATIQCVGIDMDACMAGCAFDDFECIDACFAAWESSTPDPSACTQDATVDCSGTPRTTTTGGGGGLCVGTWTGQSCDYDSDCSTNNCFQNCCYDTGPGNPCDYDSDCSSNNCYDNVCQ